MDESGVCSYFLQYGLIAVFYLHCTKTTTTADSAAVKLTQTRIRRKLHLTFLVVLHSFSSTLFMYICVLPKTRPSNKLKLKALVHGSMYQMRIIAFKCVCIAP